MSVRWFAALMMAVPATVVSIGLALPAPATLAVMPRTSWHPRDVGIDFEYAKHAKPYEKPQKTTKTIYAEEDAKQAGVGALFAEDPEMKEKIEYTGLRLKDENGFKYLTVHYTTVPAKPNDSIQTKMWPAPGLDDTRLS